MKPQPKDMPSKRGSWYYFGDKKYPSITTILGKEDKGFLNAWSGKGCAELTLEKFFGDNWKDNWGRLNGNFKDLASEIYKEFFNENVAKAGTRGTGVHNLAPRLVEDINAEYLPVYVDYVEPLKQFIKDHNPTDNVFEMSVKSDVYGIAGTCDWLCKIDGKQWLVDIKTSSGVYPNHGDQLQFYGHALSEMGINIDVAKILHLPGDGKYNLVDVPGDMEIVSALKVVYLKRLKRKP